MRRILLLAAIVACGDAGRLSQQTCRDFCEAGGSIALRHLENGSCLCADGRVSSFRMNADVAKALAETRRTTVREDRPPLNATRSGDPGDTLSTLPR